MYARSEIYDWPEDERRRPVDRRRTFRLGVLAGIVVVLGCGSPDDVEALRGQVQVRDERIAAKDQVIADKDSEIARLRGLLTENGSTAAKKLDELKREYEDRRVDDTRLQSERSAHLEGQIAELRLELSAIQRDKLQLQEIVDQSPRIEQTKAIHHEWDLLVLGLLLLLSLLVIGFVAYRYREARDRLHLLTMQQVSELRRLGGAP